MSTIEKKSSTVTLFALTLLSYLVLIFSFFPYFLDDLSYDVYTQVLILIIYCKEWLAVS